MFMKEKHLKKIVGLSVIALIAVSVFYLQRNNTYILDLTVCSANFFEKSI